MIKAKKLKHIGIVKKASSYTVTGQPDDWQTQFTAYFGIDDEKVSESNEPDNSGNAKTLYLFTYYDDRLQNGQALMLGGQLYLISQLDNVELANKRFNFTDTPL